MPTRVQRVLSGIGGSLLVVGIVAAQEIELPPTTVAQAFANQVRRQLALPPDTAPGYQALAAAELDQAGVGPALEYIVVVDRNPQVQAAFLYLRQPGAWQLLGGVPVATGARGRVDYHLTPTGVFPHTPANPDYRAQGTRNEQGIRGYGVKGMRVYDLGWQVGTKGWGAPEPRQIRLQMHATDPDYLEPKLGQPGSKGCVRISAEFNRFLDHYGVLDADYLTTTRASARWVLRSDRNPAAHPGRYVVVVDSATAVRPPWAEPTRP